MNRLRQVIRSRVYILYLAAIGIATIAYAGLETVTHIQDLNSSWPLGSDLASTSDDHIRNIKSALKTDFPNFNGTYTSASAPVLAIPSDTNTGMYSVGADDLGFSTGGTLRFDISTSAFTGTLPWRGQDGAVGAPALSFSGDTDTGIYRAAGNDMRLVSGGTAKLAVATNVSMEGGAALFINDGSAGTPGLLFNNDSNTGFYRDTADQIAISLGGTTAGQIAQGSYTGTLTGLTTSPTTTIEYVRVGNIVTLFIPGASGTSNATSFTITGAPSVIQATSGTGLFPVGALTNNGADEGNVQASLGASSGTITFYRNASSTSFTSSGTKGIPAVGIQATYRVR